LNEEELAELQSDSETVWEEMILEEPHSVICHYWSTLPMRRRD
jgi:hypothetical protein